jgi:hypothetical protein
MLAFVTGLWSPISAWAGPATLLSFLGPLAPILGGIANAAGSAISAIFEIVAALAKSPEGRVVLAIVAGGLGFLYLRFHYIEEGKAAMQPELTAAKHACHKPAERRRK